MQWFDKFIVAKTGDIKKYLDSKEQYELDTLLWKVGYGRIKDGKVSDHGYYIVNQDEIYASAVKALIEMGENLKG